ncbi:hypothetical protein MMC06_000597 [Schaereria dolodes]|nr:hypothetical protein [Schaereria dolodes]
MEGASASFHNNAATATSFEGYVDFKYDFRPSARTCTNFATTGLDQDRSGDFDPSLRNSHPKFTSTRKRERILYSGDDLEEAGPKKPKVNTWLLGRREGQSCRVKFKFTSTRGLSFLGKLRDYSDNWPEPMFLSNGLEPNFTEITSTSVQANRLRNRQLSSGAPAPCAFLHDTVLPFAEITLGHPAARGCKACLELGLPCTLLEEGSTYPCTLCIEDDFECELVVAPAKKRPCESCRCRRIVCSYRDEENHKGPCKQCDKAQLKCVAGPLSGRTRTGPSLDQDLSKPPKISKSVRFMSTPERRFVSCTGCRKAKKSCSLRRKNRGGACARCEGLGESCTFEALPQREKRIINDRRNKVRKAMQAIGQQPFTSGDVTSNLRVVKTRLAYPILFGHQVPDDGSTLCHWCDDLAYGIIGLEEVTVKLVGFADDEGYVEVEPGHIGKGREPSRMCGDCTFERMAIITCPNHEIHPIKGENPRTFDDGMALEWLDLKRAALAPFEWCSVCLGVATFACYKPADTDWVVENEEDSGRVTEGCGLCLCGSCCVSFLDEHNSNLGELIAELGNDKDLGPFSVRADAGLLCPDGEIMRRLGRR